MATLGVNVLANLHYEVEMGVEKSPLTDDIIKNDYGDLSAGLAATILYGYLVHLIDRTYSISFQKICR
jgi:hypothetical protein